VMHLKENRKSCGHDPFQQEAGSNTWEQSTHECKWA
jgi:hypothetical protein